MDWSESSVQRTKNGEGGKDTGRVVDWSHSRHSSPLPACFAIPNVRSGWYSSPHV